MRRFIIFPIYLFVATNSFAATQLDQMIGVRIGQKITNDILAAPPMPKLGDSNSTSNHLSPLVSYLAVTAKNSDTNPITNSYGPYSGSLNGYTVGLGYTRDTKGPWSFYGFGTYSQANGDIRDGANQSFVVIRDLKTTSSNFSAGISYRLTPERSRVLVGLLAGPFVSQTSSDLIYVGSGSADNYKASTMVAGPMTGLQAYVDLSGFILNPYFMYYLNVMNQCQTFETDSTNTQVTNQATGSCNAAKREVEVNGTFFAYGLNVGFRELMLGLYSKADDDSSITTTSFTLTYTFNF